MDPITALLINQFLTIPDQQTGEIEQPQVGNELCECEAETCHSRNQTSRQETGSHFSGIRNQGKYKGERNSKDVVAPFEYREEGIKN